jgi:hypothetical protein
MSKARLLIQLLFITSFFGVAGSVFAQSTRQTPRKIGISKPQNNTKPTAKDARAVIEEQISGGRFKVTSITKTNGAEFLMLNQYQIFYDVQVTCLVSEREQPFYMKTGDVNTTYAIKCGSGSLYFVKTERGWKSVTSSGHKPGWFERTKAENSTFMPNEENLVAVPIPKRNIDTSVRTIEPVPKQYEKFLGVWTYSKDFNEKHYLRITRDQQGRFQFDEGWNDDPKVASKITWSRGVLMLTNADGIFLKPVMGRLQANFVSANFRATHGMDFTYQITLQFQPNGKLLYSLSGDLQEKHTATKITEN